MTNKKTDETADALALVAKHAEWIEGANAGDRSSIINLGRAMLRGEIEPVADDENAIAERDLLADDAFAGSGRILHARDIVGVPLQVRDFNVQRSEYDEGAPIFAAIHAVVVRDPADGEVWEIGGEKYAAGDAVVVTTGMYRPLARLFAAKANGQLPTPEDRPVVFRSTETSNHFEVFTLEWLDA